MTDEPTVLAGRGVLVPGGSVGEGVVRAFLDAGATVTVPTVDETGGLDHLVAPIGGWWSEGAIGTMSGEDWRGAFVDLATSHMAVLARLGPDGSCVVVVGDSALHPVTRTTGSRVENA